MNWLLNWLYHYNPIYIGVVLYVAWLVYQRIRARAGNGIATSRGSERMAKVAAMLDAPSTGFHETGNADLDMMENDVGPTSTYTTTSAGQGKPRTGLDPWAMWTRWAFILLALGAVIRTAMLYGVSGWWALANPFALGLVTLLVALVVVHAKHGQGGSFWHLAPRLLAHEIKGLHLRLTQAPDHRVRAHERRRDALRAEAHDAHQRDQEVIRDRQFAQMMQTRMERGRVALESALNHAVPLTVVETRKMPYTTWERQKDGSSQRRTEIRDVSVKHRLARVRGRVEDLRAIYDLRWVEVAYDAKIAGAWEKLAEDVPLIVRTALGDVTPDRVEYVGHTGELRVDLLDQRIVVDLPPEPEIEDEPQAEIDDETPLAIGTPPLNLLPEGKHATGRPNEGKTAANRLVSALGSLGVVGADVVDVSVGPTAITLTVKRPPGTRGSQVLRLSEDLAIEMASPNLRLAPSSTRDGCITVEMPRTNREMVHLRAVMASEEYRKATAKMALPIPLGIDGTGRVVVVDLASAPHILSAGTTGSGKSFFLHALLASLLLSRSPEAVRVAVIDPKAVEFGLYGEAPHALVPTVTEVPSALALVDWLTEEMDRRYRALRSAGVRDIAELPADKRMPRLVLIADEIADLMLSGKKDQREAIVAKLARLLAKARASGIHCVLATQRPTVDVVPGLIKANAPMRVALAVQSAMDSRIILDAEGAEALAGKGDALVQLPGASSLIRVQTAFVGLDSVERVVEWWRGHRPVEHDPLALAALRSAGMEIALGGDDPDGPDTPDPDAPNGLDDPDADGAEDEEQEAEATESAETSAQPVVPPEGEADEANWYDAPGTGGGVATDDRDRNRGAGYRNPWDRDDDPEGEDD